MKFSEKWLREWVNPNITSEQLVDQLTMLGLEVEAITPAAPSFKGVVVGQVISTEPHPDADRLTFCKVDVGNNKILEIVCGAPNVRTGIKVAVVLVGGVLIHNQKVKKAKLRGVTSHGMICSERELGLSDQHGQIIEFPQDAPVGMDLRDYLKLDDHCIDVAITPNRGDCLSIRGLAREVAAKNKLNMAEPTVKPLSSTNTEAFPTKINAKTACPRYLGRVIRQINRDAETPIWLQERLRRSGLRSIHPVVDVTNYVMLELGQPLHAFDLDKLDSGITVRMAQHGENITLIDGQQLALTEQTLVIADAKQLQALAGIMGGQFSAVSAQTEHIFLECAYFSPSGIALSSRHYGIQSDSSYRFERGIDFELQTAAIERASELLLEIVGGEVGPINEQLSEQNLPGLKPITLRREQIQRLLGINIPDDQVESILVSLGMTLQANTSGWDVVPPSHRFDIAYEADLIEELARFYGYDYIPSSLIQSEYAIPACSESKITPSRLIRLLVDRSYHEIITYSFVNDKLQKLIDPQTQAIALVNPIASDMTVMRTSLWPGLLQALKYNQNRQIQRVRLFEIGMCFAEKGKKWEQVVKLGGVVSGNAHALQWGEAERPVDFYDLKGDVGQLLALTGREEEFRWVPSSYPALHPGQSAELYYKNQLVGLIGALHPTVVQYLDLVQVPLLFELRLDVVLEASSFQYQAISKYPTVRRDIAIVVDQSVMAEEIEQKIIDSAGQLLNTVQIFDIYAGEGIEFGKKSVALGLTFQDPYRTLIDDEINQVIDRVIVNLENAFDAKLRA